MVGLLDGVTRAGVRAASGAATTTNYSEPIYATAASAARTALAAPTSSKPAAKRRHKRAYFFLLWYDCPARPPPIRPTTFGLLRAEVPLGSSTASSPSLVFATLIRRSRQPTAERWSFARALHSQVQALVRGAERCSTLGCEPKEVNFFDWACRAERSPGARSKRASRRRRPSKAIKAHRSAAVAGR